MLLASFSCAAAQVSPVASATDLTAHVAIESAGQAGEPVGRLTLAQALALAEDRHPGLNSARLEAQAADGRVTQAMARQNPVLSFEAENFGGAGEQKRFDAAEYTAQIEQAFELGGKRGKRIRVAKTDRQLTGFDLESSRLDVRAETSRRFAGVLGAQSRVDLAGETVVLAENFVKAVAARVEAGKVSPMELEKAHVLLTQKRIALDQANGELAMARIQLAAQWGGIHPVFECAEGELSAVPAVPALATLTSRISGNPDVARWSVEIELAQAVLAREQAARIPDISGAVGIRRSGETDSDTLVAGMSLPLPLFDRNHGSILESVSLLAKARQQGRAAEMKTATELATAHQVLTTTANRASSFKNDVLPRVKAVFDAVQSGYTQGKYTYLEALDAERTMVESQVEYIDALISARTALADLDRIVDGQLQTRKQE